MSKKCRLHFSRSTPFLGFENPLQETSETRFGGGRATVVHPTKGRGGGVAGNNWYNAIELSWMILARMLNVWLLLLASFSFLCTKGVDPANPSTSTKTNLLHTPPFVGLLHGASPACCFCRCCGLTKDHTVQCVYLSSCFGIIKLVGCVQETHGQYVSDLAFCFCLAEPIPHLLYLQSLEG